MKISCTTLACPDWPLETVLKNFKEYGYDAVDFRGLQGEMDIFRLPAFTSDSADTAGKIAASGLAVSAFSSSATMFRADPLERKQQVAEVAEYARLCRRFSAPIIRVFGGARGDTPDEQAVEIAAGTLKEMARAAGKDVTVAVETHDDWVRSSLLAEVFKRLDEPNVGVLWDPHNPFRQIGETPKQAYENLGQWIVAIHLKDSNPTADGGHEFCLAGEGDVPLAEAVALLRAGGYDGYLTLEWEKKWHPQIAEPEVAIPAYAGFLRELAR